MPGEEGVIYGYNRHLYGGIEPSTMKTFGVITLMDIDTGMPVGSVINAIPPDDTVVDEEVLCSVAGTKLIYNVYHEPVNEFDGEVITKLKPGETLANFHWIPPNQNGIILTAFLKAFPYSTNNVYGRNSKNCAIFNPPPAVDALSVTQTFDSEAQKYNVNVSITVPIVINKVVVGRINGTLMGDSPITPEECDWIIENDASSKTLSVIDTEVESAQQYTYIVFPSISNDIYNTDATNRISVTVSDATPPGDLTALSLVSLDREGAVRINIDWPEDCDGATVVYKTGSYPANINDGTVKNLSYHMYDSPSQPINHHPIYNGLTPGETYYFRFFPYHKNIESDGSVTKIHNMNNTDANKTSVEMRQHTYLFGFDLDEEDPDPATRISYPDDVDNAEFAPVTASGYGSWANILSTAGKYFMPRPCMLKYTDDTILEYLDPNDYTKTIDGTTSHITDRTCGANAMMEWPKIYTKRWKTDNIYHFRVSDMAINQDYDCWCNWNKNDKTVGHFYTAIYPTNNQVDLPRSLSGLDFDKSSAPGWVTFEDFTGYEEVLTPNGWYGTLLFSQAQLMTDLFLLCFRSNLLYNIISTYSSNKSGLSTSFKTGFANTNGLWRMTTTPNYSKLFGMEYLIGWGYTPLLGYSIYYENVNNSAKTYYVVKITPGKHDGSTSNDFSRTNMNRVITNTDILTQLGFMKKGETLYNGNGYTAVTKMNVYPWGRIPSTQSLSDSGGTTTYEAIYEFLRTPAEIQQYYYYIMFGASYAGYSAGPAWLCAITSARSSNIRNNAILRLTCIPPTSDNLGYSDIAITDPL